MPPTIEERFIRIVSDQFCFPIEDIDTKDSFMKDLGADSLDFVELIMMVEEEFKIEIPDDDVENICTVKEAIDYINRRIS